jgi:hypothetical protein
MIVDAKKLSFSLMTRQLPLEKQDVNLRRDKSFDHFTTLREKLNNFNLIDKWQEKRQYSHE